MHFGNGSRHQVLEVSKVTLEDGLLFLLAIYPTSYSYIRIIFHDTISEIGLPSEFFIQPSERETYVDGNSKVKGSVLEYY